MTEPYGVAAGADGMARLLALKEPPTAVFCYSDEIAVSAMHLLHQRGLRVPDDISLIGVDGHDLGALFGITTIDQHVAEQARAASEMVLELLAGHQPVQPRLTLCTDLVVRGSTAPPRQAEPTRAP